MGRLVDPHNSDPQPLSGPGHEDLVQLAIESAPNGILVIAPDGVIVLVNREIERQFGYPREEMIGRPVEILLPEALRAVHAAHREGFARDPQARVMGAGRSVVGRRKDGSEIPVEIALNPIRVDQRVFVLASVVDITARRRLETDLNLAVERRLTFEQLIAELSTKFINLPTGQVEDWIEDSQRRLVELLDLDRSSLWVEKDGDFLYEKGWTRPGFPRVETGKSAKESLPWTLEKMVAGELVSFSSVDALPDVVDRASYRAYGNKSTVAVPLLVDGRCVGAMGFVSIRAERTWSPEVLNQFQMIANLFANALARREADGLLRKALNDVLRLRDQLQNENILLRREVQERLGTGILIGQSPAMRRVLEQVQQVAETDSTVLILGETGSGKGMFATQIHELSARRDRAMVRVNCAAIPATLIESELFGREKGAYTGALTRQIGRFELADRSTLFLDEIGDLPADVQVKLLRVLEDRQFERLGNPRSITVDTRVIAATHRNLEQAVEAGTFREDLFYRLNVFPITVPPLRERAEDIPLLVWRFVDEFSRVFGKPIESIGKDTMTALQHYPWPGNIRELRNVVERAMIVATSTRLTIPTPATPVAAAKHSAKLIEVEKEHIRSVLESTGWRVRGAGGAADRLGLKPTTLESRIDKLGLKNPRRQSG